eukprot:2385449-Pleurochrysis_carterae.AAC.1
MAVLATLKYRIARRRVAFERKLKRLQDARVALGKRGADSRDGPCPICLEQLPQPPPQFAAQHTENGAELLHCGHVFHHACIDQWLRKGGQQAQACPVCRRRDARVPGALGSSAGEHSLSERADRFGRTERLDRMDRVVRVADASDGLHFAMQRLSEEFVDLPGVHRMRAALQAAGYAHDWVEVYYESVASHMREEAAEAAARAIEAHRAAEARGSGGWAAGGVCDGGGGAGGSW